MNTIQKIRRIMGLPKSKFYAEVKIDDGRVLVTEADAFAPGVEVRVIDETGSTVPLDAGAYTLEDGRVVIINADSRMESFESDDLLPEEEVKIDVELEEDVLEEKVDEEILEEEIEEEEKIDFKTALEEVPGLTEKQVEAIVAVADNFYDVAEDIIDNIVEEKTEMHGLLVEAFTSINKRLKTLENKPAESGLKVSPTNLASQHKKKDLSKLNGVDRALHIIQNSHR